MFISLSITTLADFEWEVELGVHQEVERRLCICALKAVFAFGVQYISSPVVGTGSLNLNGSHSNKEKAGRGRGDGSLLLWWITAKPPIWPLSWALSR